MIDDHDIFEGEFFTKNLQKVLPVDGQWIVRMRFS